MLILNGWLNQENTKGGQVGNRFTGVGFMERQGRVLDNRMSQVGLTSEQELLTHLQLPLCVSFTGCLQGVSGAKESRMSITSYYITLMES